jgi:glycosyltransferase involved in cell wall biosynthesis
MNKDRLITVASVLCNDRSTVERFVKELTEVLSGAFQYYEIVLVDNGSTDGTSEIVIGMQEQIPNLRLIRLSRQYPDEIALCAGLENGIGDFVVLMDSQTDPVNMVLPLVERAFLGSHVVIGQRSGQDDTPLLRRILRKPFYSLASKILGVHLDPMASQFRVLSRQAVNSITRVRNKNRSLRYLNAFIGFEPAYVPYQQIKPNGSSRQTTQLKSALIAIDMIVSNSAAPLRFASALALLGSVLNLVYFGYILLVSIIKNKVAEGWITTNVSHTSMFFLLFIVLTILTEYIARIREETQDRPLYFVDFETHSNSISFDPQATKDRLNVV